MSESPGDTLKVLLGLTGSVASIKAVQLARALKSITPSPRSNRRWRRVEVRAVTTERAKHFYQTKDLEVEVVSLHCDDEEWQWKERGDPVLHIGESEMHLCTSTVLWFTSQSLRNAAFKVGIPISLKCTCIFFCNCFVRKHRG